LWVCCCVIKDIIITVTIPVHVSAR
jgi:hypothetical protein